MGLGYVGLPLAMAASRAGLKVLGFDISADKVAALGCGRSYIDDVADGDVAAAIDAGFEATTDPARLRSAQAISICVPTPLEDGLPDLRYIAEAARTVGENLVTGQLVVLESTTYPGTTEEVVLPVLEGRSGLSVGRGFHLAYSPERIDPGNQEWTIANTPKVVGGIDRESTDLACSLYGKFCGEVVAVKGPKEAEMAKLLENTYRHVNIALVNELAIFSRELGIDIWEAIRAASSKPFGFQAFYPGPGVGGHCIPIDPSYLSYKVRQLGFQFRFVELAQEINSRMPSYVVERATRLLNDNGRPVRGSTVMLAGVAYKPDVSDIRETPASNVGRLLMAMGAELTYADPHVGSFLVDDIDVARCEDPVTGAAAADLVIILTPHSSLDLEAICRAAPLTLDTRGAAPPGLAHTL